MTAIKPSWLLDNSHDEKKLIALRAGGASLTQIFDAFEGHYSIAAIKTRLSLVNKREDPDCDDSPVPTQDDAFCKALQAAIDTGSEHVKAGIFVDPRPLVGAFISPRNGSPGAHRLPRFVPNSVRIRYLSARKYPLFCSVFRVAAQAY
jgi:hypothetical protein